MGRPQWAGQNPPLNTPFSNPKWATLLLCLCLVIVTGCNKTDKKVETKTEALLIAPEDIVTIHSSTFASGPTITGSIQPERRADLQSEISSVVLQVLKENGEPVNKGDLLIRLDDTTIRDNLRSAQESERAAHQTLEQAQRQLERYKTLRAQGMVSAQGLEDAENKRNTAQSDVSAAAARTAQARQQLQRTEIRAPFAGIVTERKVSNGDTAQIGKPLMKVIDPNSMRFEGLISADAVALIKVGQNVNFKINGYEGQNFLGTIKRISPEANTVTRQVEVLVNFNDAKQPRVSGLYAEGQVEASNVATLMVPEIALLRSGDKVSAWKIAGNALHKTDVILGAKELRSGAFMVKSGLVEGDQLLRNPSTTLKDGQAVDTSNKHASEIMLNGAVPSKAAQDATQKTNPNNAPASQSSTQSTAQSTTQGH